MKKVPMHLVVLALAVPIVLGRTSGLAAQDAQPSAEQLMVESHAARASWEGMPGFTAELQLSDNGRTGEGTLEVKADGSVDVSVPEEFAWTENRLRSLVQHRQGGQDEYDVSFADEVATHPLGRLITINDDALMGSRYRVEEDVIREVHRNMEGTKFTITVIDVQRNSEGKYLPKVYAVSFWDAKTEDLKSTVVYHDHWTRVGQWDLPDRLLSIETADGGQRQVREIQLQNHRLTDSQN